MATISPSYISLPFLSLRPVYCISSTFSLDKSFHKRSLSVIEYSLSAWYKLPSKSMRTSISAFLNIFLIVLSHALNLISLIKILLFDVFRGYQVQHQPVAFIADDGCR